MGCIVSMMLNMLRVMQCRKMCMPMSEKQLTNTVVLSPRLVQRTHSSNAQAARRAADEATLTSIQGRRRGQAGQAC